MGKVRFLLGVGLGLVVGSKMGEETYQRLESTVRGVVLRSGLQERLDEAKATAAALETLRADLKKLGQAASIEILGDSTPEAAKRNGSAAQGRSAPTVAKRTSRQTATKKTAVPGKKTVSAANRHEGPKANPRATGRRSGIGRAT